MNDSTITDSGLEGRTATVTGGSGGIGRAIVQTLAAAGMNVVFTYRGNAKAAQELVAASPAEKVSDQILDVRDSAACTALAEKVFDQFGRIDVLVNNAGVIRDNQLTALEDADVNMNVEPEFIDDTPSLTAGPGQFEYYGQIFELHVQQLVKLKGSGGTKRFEVLVRDAHMPDEAALPPSLGALAYRNGLAVRPDPDFHHDMDRLIEGLEQATAGAPA